MFSSALVEGFDGMMMNVEGLGKVSYILPDSTTANIMGKGESLLEEDPFSDFLMGTGGDAALTSLVSEADVSSTSVEDSSDTITLLPPPSFGEPPQQTFFLQEPQTCPPVTEVISAAPLGYPEMHPAGDLYTLTLTDGTAFQLRVQTCDSPTRNTITSSDVSSSTALAPPSQGEDLLSALTTLVTSPEETADWISSQSDDSPQPDYGTILQSLLSKDPKTPEVSPPSLSVPSDDFFKCKNNFFSRLSSGSEEDEETDEDEKFFLDSSIFEGGEVNLEKLKNQFCHLPDGQADLGSILEAAKVDLTVEDIVSPTLTVLKKIMDQRGLSDWQIQLCLKIRRRKKNTAAVRSSRQKRSLYVINLRQKVSELSKRRKEAQLENSLLKQLKSLWERLCYEVETEVIEGTRKKQADIAHLSH